MTQVLGGNYNMPTKDDYDAVINNSNNKSAYRNKHINVVDRDVQNDRALMKGHENISPIQELTEHQNVLKRDIASLTELHKILVTVSKFLKNQSEIQYF